jgi:alpha-D-xyloside xylohydrolase
MWEWVTTPVAAARHFPATHPRGQWQPMWSAASSSPCFPRLLLVFKEQYLGLTTALPREETLYGLSENTPPGGIRLRPNDPYTLYTTDINAINLNTDLYGSHPMYMDLRNLGGRGVAHAVLLLNSNRMDVFKFVSAFEWFRNFNLHCTVGL